MINIYSPNPLLEYSCRNDLNPSIELLFWIPATCHSKVLPLCFPIKGIRLISSFPCVTLAIRVHLDRPMRNEEIASWDLGQMHMGSSGLGVGTVSVSLGAQKIARGEDISSTRYYKDDSCWSADLKSKITEDIISNRSFMEVLVLNHYVLVKKVLLVSEPGYRELDNDAKDENLKCWPACYRMTRRGTSVLVGRGGRGSRPREGNHEHVDDLNGQGNEQGMGANKGVEGVNGNVEGANGGAPDFSTIIAQKLQNLLLAMLAQNVRNVLVNGNRVGCSYKEFLACNPKEYDGKGGAVVLTRWIEKMKNVQDMSGCSINQKVKYTADSFVEFCPSHDMQKFETELWNRAMVGAGHAAYIDRFYKLARLFPHLVTPKSRKIERNGSIKKVEKRGNVGEPSNDKNDKDDNKRTRTGNAFATTANPVRRDNAAAWPKCATCNSYQAPKRPCRTCFNCNLLRHLAKDCRGMSRNVNPVNAGNPPVRACYECGSIDHVRSACPRWNRA
nr:hypothetical protein [Tanacetum cinerariifolium]